MSANQLDDDFDGPAAVADKKPTRDDVLGVLKWSAPREVATKLGPRLVSSADANDLVFDLWRDEKDSLKGDGYSLGEFRGKWQISKWEKLPEKIVVSRENAKALSRATDADINVPAPDGLAYLGYQKAGIAFGFERKAVLIGDEMGLGKTIQAIGILNACPELKRVLVICPASLKINWKRELDRWCVRKRPILIADSKTFIGLADGVTIVNYDVLHKHGETLRTTEWDALICDEAHFCFPEGTLVQTDRGVRRIDWIVKHRRPVVVASCAEDSDRIVWRSVTGWHQHQVYEPLVRVIHSNGTFDCTGDHRVFVEGRGWTAARETRVGDLLRILPENLFREASRPEGPKVLQQKLQRPVSLSQPELRQGANRADEQSEIESSVCASSRLSVSDDGSESYVNPKRKSEDGGETQRKNVLGERGKREANGSAGSTLPGNGGRLDDGARDKHETREREVSVFADSLQRRSGVSLSKTSGGGGRSVSSQPSVEIFGPPQDRNTSVSRVDRVEILEQGDRSGTTVYCLDVEGTHSFFANGALVHNCKNPAARRTKMVFGERATAKEKKAGMADVPGLSAKKRILLSGTPIANKPVELFPLINYLDPITWGNEWKFKQRYCGAHYNGFGWEFNGASHLDELQDKLRSTIMVRRLKKDVLTELPPKRRQVIEFPATGDLARIAKQGSDLYDEVENLEAEVELAAASDNPNSYADAVKKLSKGQSACFEGLSTLRIETGRAIIPLAVEHIKEVLEEVPKVVIFGHHKEVLAAVKSALGDTAVMIVGDTPMADRQANADRFQKDPTCTAIIGSFGAMGVGWTLTAADHLVTVEQDWVPGVINQGEDRIHRIGQTRSVLIQHLVIEGSIGATIMKRTVAKQNVIDQALDVVSAPKDAQDGPAVQKPESVALSDLANRMTDLQREAAAEAIVRLRDMCDGAGSWDGSGFSKIDVKIGHSLAAQANDPRGLSKKQAALAQKVAWKYRGQLPDELVDRLKFAKAEGAS